MCIKRTYLTAILATAAAVAAIFSVFIASPPNVQLSYAPIHDLPLDDFNLPGVPGNIDYGVPDINAPDIIDVPNINVPNINMPNINVNPGQVGLPGRGR